MTMNELGGMLALLYRVDHEAGEEMAQQVLASADAGFRRQKRTAVERAIAGQMFRAQLAGVLRRRGANIQIPMVAA